MSSKEPTSRPGRRAWLGIVFVVVLVQLLAWNVYAIVRNQTLLGPDETPRPRPGNIVTLAMKNPADVVRFVLATFYYLRVIEGSHLVVPERLATHRLFLERVSRVQVELVPRVPVLTAEAALRLQELVARRYYLMAGVPVDVVLDTPARSRYEMVAYPDRGWMILPEARVAGAVEPAR